MAERHHLELVDRGPQHRHRWQASCSCGRSCPPMRLRKTAKDWHAGHVRQRNIPKGVNRPRPVTPVDQLPEELR